MALAQGCVPTVKGDGQSYYHTSYQAQFKGEWSPPAKPNEKHKSAVKFGDPRSSGSVSEQKHAHRAPDKRTCRVYGKERAASQIHRTNLQLGDGCTRFSTLMSELFPVHSIEPVTIACPNKYASSIPRGDEGPERNQALARTTTMQLSYPETDRWNFAPKPDLLLQKHRSNICLGDVCSGSRFFSTTQHSDYQPPCQSQRVMADSKSHRESHIPFNDHTDESSVTTTQAMLVPRRQQNQRLPEDMLQQLKCSHLGLPWRAPDLFRTEQKDEFTSKSRGPAEIQKANSQVNCIPLGTLRRYGPQRKVLFAQ
ncbi:stabilizer of axonemal microtubules 5 [Cariama cristata]